MAVSSAISRVSWSQAKRERLVTLGSAQRKAAEARAAPQRQSAKRRKLYGKADQRTRSAPATKSSPASQSRAQLTRRR
jgi:hypothetical protein